MQIVIDIPEKDYKAFKSITSKDTIFHNAIPLSEVLDKIRAEIVELRSRQNVGVLECLDIIDKYRKEQSNADSD